jgi:hypothetical protein
MIEHVEYNDWHILPSDTNEKRRTNSISAYYLDKTYPTIANISFPTVFYPNIESIPDVLPFDQCMVRYENKSPKDSEHWGPIQTKIELLRMFYTSLRCKTNPGQIYCVRQWSHQLQTEFRCFYNSKLVAISGSDHIDSEEIDHIIPKLIAYITKEVEPILCFYRCVFDIALLNNGSFIFVEFNSWETNSGAHRFDWIDSTEILYPEDKFSTNVVCNWKDSNLSEIQTRVFQNLVYERKNTILSQHNLSKSYDYLYKNMYKLINDFDLTDFVILNPINKNWLKTNTYIYAFNDIWLGRFDLNLKPINWIRGIFRYCTIEQTSQGLLKICSENSKPTFYYKDLRKYTGNIICEKQFNSVDQTTYLDSTIYGFKYGIGMLGNGKKIFASIGSDCNLTYYILS